MIKGRTGTFSGGHLAFAFIPSILYTFLSLPSKYQMVCIKQTALVLSDYNDKLVYVSYEIFNHMQHNYKSRRRLLGQDQRFRKDIQNWIPFIFLLCWSQCWLHLKAGFPQCHKKATVVLGVTYRQNNIQRTRDHSF